MYMVRQEMSHKNLGDAYRISYHLLIIKAS